MHRLAGGEPVRWNHLRAGCNAAQCLLAYGGVAWVVLETRIEERHPEADRPTLRAHVGVMRDGAVGTEGQPTRLRIFKQHPDGREVGSTVAGSDIAPVDDSTEQPVFHAHVPRM